MRSIRRQLLVWLLAGLLLGVAVAAVGTYLRARQEAIPKGKARMAKRKNVDATPPSRANNPNERDEGIASTSTHA